MVWGKGELDTVAEISATMVWGYYIPSRVMSWERAVDGCGRRRGIGRNAE